MSNNFDLLESQSTNTDPKEVYFESERRDIYYSALIKDIVQNNRTTQKYKLAFFIVICAVFIGICVVGSIVIIKVSNSHEITFADLGVAITGFAGVISSILVLPKIIAKHLFPENSETARFNLIRDNQKFDLENHYGGSSDGDEDTNNTYDENMDESDRNGK